MTIERASLTNEKFDDHVFLAGDVEVARAFVNRYAFTAMKIGVSVRFRLLEIPSRVLFAVGEEADNLIAMRIHRVNATFRVDGDAAELLKALFAEERPFELVIVRSERFPLVIQSARLWRRESVSEIESLIGDQNRVIGRDGDIDNLAAKNLVTELGQARAGFDIPDLYPPVSGVRRQEQPRVRESDS